MFIRLSSRYFNLDKVTVIEVWSRYMPEVVVRMEDKNFAITGDDATALINWIDEHSLHVAEGASDGQQTTGN